MNATTAPTSHAARSTTHRWIRQIHLWIGAWGALAAIIYGFTGLVMNHRFGDGAWPQGDSEESGPRDAAGAGGGAGDAGSSCRLVARDPCLDAQVSARAATGRREARRAQRAAAARNGTFPAAPRRARGRWNTCRATPPPKSSRAAHAARRRSTACTRASAAAGPGPCSPTASPSACCCSACPGIWMWARGRTREADGRERARLSLGAGVVLGLRCLKPPERCSVPPRCLYARITPSSTRRRRRARCAGARAPACEQGGVARSQRRQSGLVGETRVPGDQVHRPGRARLGEDHHRPDQRPVPQLRVDRVAPPHQVEVLGRADRSARP